MPLGEKYLPTWARGRLHDPRTGATELRQALATYVDQGNKLFAPHCYGLLAELEAETRSRDVALT